MTNDITACNWWLMKSEPDVYGIDHLQKEGSTLWDGIRNYQARNFMRQMNLNDLAFFYHSNCQSPCISGLMKVTEVKIVDPTQFDSTSKYFAPKSTKEKAIWDCVKVAFLKKFARELSLKELKSIYSQDELQILRKGNRLSITPISSVVAKDILERIGD